MKRSFLPINELLAEPYCMILGFPKFTKRQLHLRVEELKSLGITKVAFWGPIKIGSLDVLGKGYVGIVILGRMKNRTVAIKIRRTDSSRAELKTEAGLLRLVNEVQVGPKFIASSRNFLVMEYLDGIRIGNWISTKKTVEELKRTLYKVLQDCRRLDTAGIDHGELSTISKHVIVGRKTTMIDFESSSIHRRVSNVTSAAQGLFIGSGISRIVTGTYKTGTKKSIIAALRRYKRNMTDESFDDLLKVLRL